MARGEVERLYDSYGEMVFRFAWSLTGCEGEGKEVLQDVFVKLARSGGGMGRVRDERAFLLKATRNAVIDRARRAGARRRAVERYSLESGGLFFAEDGDPDVGVFAERLEEAMGALPEEQRGVVYLKLWEGLTFVELGGAFGISENTAASRFRYGIDKLRGLLRPLYDEIKER